MIVPYVVVPGTHFVGFTNVSVVGPSVHAMCPPIARPVPAMVLHGRSDRHATRDELPDNWQPAERRIGVRVDMARRNSAAAGQLPRFDACHCGVGVAPPIAMRALLLALLVGCGGVSDSAVDAAMPDVPDTSMEDGATMYTPSTPFSIATLHAELVDAARSRTVAYDVVYPTNAVGPRPVVIWSHGGLVRGGSHDGTDGWSEWLAAAGYVVVVPFHIPEETPTSYTAMCADNNIPDVECPIWMGMFTHRPLDASFLIDSLATIEAASPALAGKLDRERIAVGGHSAGTTSGLSMLGATQQWVQTAGPYTHVDPRVDAVLAASPQGPRSAGFASGFGNRAFETIDRPMLSVTGVGDDTGEPPRARRAAYETAIAGDQWLSWDLDMTVHHDTFNREDCAGALADRCAWFGAIGIAFLDAYLLENPAAMEWLSGTAPTAPANGMLELTRR